MNINNILKKYIDLNYKEFHKKICNTKYNILGIKIPILKDITKNLLKEYDYKFILNNLNNKDYEHIMIQGLTISYAKISYEERLILIEQYISKIDNWALCDTFCSSLKFINKNKEFFLNYLEKYFISDKEYYQRFGIVILLQYYLDDNYIDYSLNKILEITSDYYYVKMAISWLISMAFIKDFDKTLKFILNNKNNIDTWIINKGLQKTLESYRVNDKNKEIIRKIKNSK